jgi:hypothetical protein
MDDNRIGTRVRQFFVYEYMDDNRRRTRVRRFFVNEYMDDNRGGKTSELAGDGESVLRSKASLCHSSPLEAVHTNNYSLFCFAELRGRRKWRVVTTGSRCYRHRHLTSQQRPPTCRHSDPFLAHVKQLSFLIWLVLFLPFFSVFFIACLVSSDRI